MSPLGARLAQTWIPRGSASEARRCPALREGTPDLLIGLMPEQDEALVSHAIVEDVVVVVASRNHPVFALPRVTLKALLSWRWVLPAASIPSRQWIDAAFRSHGLTCPATQIDANSIPLLPRLIAKTELLSFLSRHTLNEHAHALREVPLKEATLRRRLGVTYRRKGYLSPAALRLMALLQERGEALFSAALGDE